MARRKQPNPQRADPDAPSDLSAKPGSTPTPPSHDFIDTAAEHLTHIAEETPDHGASIFQVIICVAGIYGSFLTWALLQERITTTSYGPDKRIFRASLVLNTVQSAFGSISGYIYFRTTTASKNPRLFPSFDVAWKLLLVSITQTLASPFGYASLAHIDYITYILAKSCKLLPVMFLHVTLFRRKYPLYKYAVVFAVTIGVAVFTLYPAHPKARKSKKAVSDEEKNVLYGLSLLGLNLLFDGLTNTIQDEIFAGAKKSITGPQMMAALNLLATILTSTWLVVNPWSNELANAVSFVRRHPQIIRDIVGFAVCGSVGQLFIFHTLAKFGSLMLVTVTVTRKMLSMVFSVVAFGHRLSRMQMLGVAMVFTGIGTEAGIKMKKEKEKEAQKKVVNGVDKRS